MPVVPTEKQQTSEPQASLALIASCLAGDVGAWREFQDTYGELIYGYPIRAYRVPPGEAAGFYVFAFDEGRIFRRLQSFEGRAPLRAYLLGYVLDTLVIDWQRADRKLETTSIEDLPNPDIADPRADPTLDSTPAATLEQVLDGVAPERAIIMKLLYAEDVEFSAADIQQIAKASGKPVRQVLMTIEEMRAAVREKESERKELEDGLDAIQSWIQLYEQRVRDIDRDLGRPGGRSFAAEDEREILRGKLERRHEQRRNLLARMKGHRVTVSYQQIAELLNTNAGTVGSTITRLRQELQRRGVPGWLAERGEAGEE